MYWILNGATWILEENALADHSRVERFASERLGMVHVDQLKKLWLLNN